MSYGSIAGTFPGDIHPAAPVPVGVSGLRDTCRTIRAMTHRVAVLALDGVLPLDLGIPARVFNEARAPDGSRLYSVGTCSLGGRPVRTHEDFRIVVEHDESLLDTADTVVIATQEPTPDLLATGTLPEDVTAVLKASGRGRAS